MTMRYLISVLIVGCILCSCGGGSDGDGDVQYVAIGASDAVGVGAFPPTDGYVFQIQETLQGPCNGVELLNLGIPAAEADVIENVEVPAAIEFDPDFITVWVGSNDLVAGRSTADFQNDLADILTTLSTDTNAVIFVANLPMLTQLPRFQDEPDADVTQNRVDAFNVIITTEAQSVGAVLIDLTSIPITNVLVSEDGFHPSSEGHAEIARRFAEQIEPALCLPNGSPSSS